MHNKFLYKIYCPFICVIVKCVRWIHIKDVPPPFSSEEHFWYRMLQPDYLKFGELIIFIFKVFELGAYQNTLLKQLIVFLNSVAAATKAAIN